MSDLFNDRRNSDLGDCVDCGRNENHRWHKPGHAMQGDGQLPHRYNPEGAEFQRLTPED